MKQPLKFLDKTAAFLTCIFPLLLLAGSALADAALSLIALLMVIRSCALRDWSWTRQAWLRCLFLLWLYMVLRSCFAEEPAEALRRSLPFMRYGLFAAALSGWILENGKTRTTLFAVLAFTVLFLSVDGLLQRVAGYDLFLRPFIMDNGHIRLTGAFRSEILGIMLAWLSFPVLIALLMDQQGKIMLKGKSLLIFLVIAVIALSGERMALLLMLFGWLLAVCILPVRRLYLLGIVAAGIALVVALAWFSPELFQRQIVSTVGTLQHWQDSPYGKLLASDREIAAINPVFGVGTNHFRIACKALFADPDQCNIHPHNIYFEWFIEQGIIGFSLFTGFIVSLYALCWRNWQDNRHNPLFIGIFIALTLRLLPFISSTGFFSRWGAPPFWLLAGWLLFYAADKKTLKIKT